MSQIKSKDRVRELAEVYTNEREVNAMLDLIPLAKPDDIISYRYLEPACGNGNFLIEILRRKLKRINEKYAGGKMYDYQFYVARAVSTIYGIDICPENVSESRERLYSEIKSVMSHNMGSYHYSEGFLSLIRYILNKNIVVGDSINAAHAIEFVEFKILHTSKFERRFYQFSSLSETDPKPTRVIPEKNFLQIGLEYQKEVGKEDEGIQRHLDLICVNQ